MSKEGDLIMAKKEIEEQENDDDNGAKKGGASTLKIIIISVTLAVILGGGLVGGTFYFVNNMNGDTASVNEDGADSDGEDDDEVAESEPVEPPKYYSMDPKFVVSFSNQSKARFMQFSLEIMSRDSAVIKQIEDHMPVIRSSLLMLFGVQGYEAMVTREGKEKLLTDTTNDINMTLQKISGDEESMVLVEAAYFNSFVIQ